MEYLISLLKILALIPVLGLVTVWLSITVYMLCGSFHRAKFESDMRRLRMASENAEMLKRIMSKE